MGERGTIEGAAVAAIPQARSAKKKAFTRAPRDTSQRLRRAVQLGFLALNVWIGVEFVRFVHFYETAGRVGAANRPPGIEGWLPIASLMNLKIWIVGGYLPRVHPAGMFLLIAFLAISWLLRKSFCSWLCPVGTLSEYLWRLGRETFRKNWKLPRALDIVLRGAKYLLLGLFLYAIAGMSVVALRGFLEGPYGLIADVKLLNFFRYLSLAGEITLAAVVLASVFIQNFWCRYLCPYGALLGIFSLSSPLRIRRNATLCIDCTKCAKECPSQLPVDRLIHIASAECTGCLECVAVCPAAGALQMSAAGTKRAVPAWAIAVAMTALFFGACAYARWSGHWQTDLPGRVYMDLVPRAAEFSHP
jgi:polyferredoxin